MRENETSDVISSICLLFRPLYFVPSLVPNKPSLDHFMRESGKMPKKPLKPNFARSFKHMTTVFYSNNFNTKKYTKWCCVPSFVTNKPNLNYFMRESAKNAKKQTLKTQLST